MRRNRPRAIGTRAQDQLQRPSEEFRVITARGRVNFRKNHPNLRNETLISYTWSKALDDGSAIRGTGIAGQNLGDMYPEDPRCRRCEKGPSAFNTPARLVASMLY